MAKPDLTAAPDWYHRYINAVDENDLTEAFKTQAPLFSTFFESIPIEKKEFRYAEGKWTIKDIIQHIIDTERVFAYRAMRFARKDETPLAGYDENLYADNAKTENRSWDTLIEEFNIVRRSSEILFNSFDDEQLNASGIASGNPISVSMLGFIIVGHINHHITIIKERYL